MKRERTYVEKRRDQILMQIVKQPGIRVEQLADFFRISQITIRRDLQCLEDIGLITRFYGGAMPTEKANKYAGKDEVDLYRYLIAKYAASLLEDNDTIFINTSRNALQMTQYVDKKNIKVITNNGNAIRSEHSHNVSVYLTGGEIRYPKEALVGEFAERNLMKVYAKKAFIGCSGISMECGVTTENSNEVNLNELMIQRATKECYILADHTKIGINSSFRSCGIEKVRNIITDEKAPLDIVTKFREFGINVYQVRKKDFS